MPLARRLRPAALALAVTALTATLADPAVATGGEPESGGGDVGIGAVLGEDAVELSAGATSCTSQCQAQTASRAPCPCRGTR